MRDVKLISICDRYGRYEWQGRAVRVEGNWPVSQNTLSKSRSEDLDSGGRCIEKGNTLGISWRSEEGENSSIVALSLEGKGS